MQALILAGGRGERLRPLTDNVPKSMLLVQDKPFLSYLVKSLSSQGIADFIFATGYKFEAIEGYFHSGQDYGIKIQYSKEEIPLGTAGPVKKAENLIDGDDLLILNGDTFVQIDLKEMMSYHKKMGRPITIAAVRAGNPSRYGQLIVNNGVISEFREKGKDRVSQYINAGVYIIKKEILKFFSGERQDFERDIFPRFLNNIAAFKTDGYFIDIGIKEDYYRFNEEVKNLSILTN
jgi:D-glycero-alpha-D-manno-heptose 1-phosphate guanylyltransferase